MLLHRLDGGEVLINSRHVTSLHSQALPHRKLYPVTAHCVVGLLDGMRLSVLGAVRHRPQITGRGSVG